MRTVFLAVATVSLPATALAAPTGELTPIASPFDVNDYLRTSVVPADSGADVGAFRFVCEPTHTLRTDPIVYPGMQFAGHVHTFSGNGTVDGDTDYTSLRGSAPDASRCVGYAINQSAYWMPSLISKDGETFIPDYFNAYYKMPNSCAGANSTTAACQQVHEIPVGLQLVAGVNMNETDPAKIASNLKAVHARCLRGNTAVISDAKDFQSMWDAGCGTQDGDVIILAVSFPGCWNGDSLADDHRSHVIPPVRNNNTGVVACPASHPIQLPAMTQQMQYTLMAGDFETFTDPMTNTQKRRGPYLASDRFMGHVHPDGSTIHADYMEAWDRSILTRWHGSCLLGHRNCDESELGDGQAGLYPPNFKFTAAARGQGRFYPPLPPEPQPEPDGAVTPDAGTDPGLTDPGSEPGGCCEASPGSKTNALVVGFVALLLGRRRRRR
ncbi:MAG TPA: DUF1996 domain-containing protein [Kofleriaceae bacterium]|nr:DUF1996 domain-containing protein [Kofleriaceae bacterium]